MKASLVWIVSGVMLPPPLVYHGLFSSLQLSTTRRELGRMVDGQLATQTAMNDSEVLLGRLTSRYGDEAAWQLSTPSSLYKIASAGVPSPQVEHALSSFFLSCTCCLHWARKGMSPQSRGLLPAPRWQLELDLYICSGIFAVRCS